MDPEDAGQLAARYCSACPVQPACADYGVTSRAWGVWGGVELADGKPVVRSGDVAA